MDSAIQQINLFPAYKYYEDQLPYPRIVIYPACGYRYPPFEQLDPEIYRQYLLLRTAVLQEKSRWVPLWNDNARNGLTRWEFRRLSSSVIYL